MEARGREIWVADGQYRVYRGVKGPVLRDAGRAQQLRLATKGCNDTALWGPFGDAAAGFADFLCLGPVQYTSVALRPGHRWTGTLALLAERPPEGDETGVATDDAGRRYVPLSHPCGARARVYLRGAVVAAYVDASGAEWLPVLPGSGPWGLAPDLRPLLDAAADATGGAAGDVAPAVDWAVRRAAGPSVTLELPPDAARALWGRPVACACTIVVGPAALETEIAVRNTGDAGPVVFGAAARALLHGLSPDGVTINGWEVAGTYLDRLARPPVEKLETAGVLWGSGPMDRVYYDCSSPVIKALHAGRQLAFSGGGGWTDTALWTPPAPQDSLGVTLQPRGPVTLPPGDEWTATLLLAPGSLALPLQQCVETDAQGERYVTLTHPSGARAVVYLADARATAYSDSDGVEWLAGGAGITPCFPLPGADPGDGSATALPWRMQECTATSVTLELTPSEATGALWDAPFVSAYTVTVGAEALSARWTVENTGGELEGGDFEFGAGLRAHLRATETATLAGPFQGTNFVDRLTNPPQEHCENRPVLQLSDVYDREYLNASGPITLTDPGTGQQMQVHGPVPFCLLSPGPYSAFAASPPNSKPQPRSNCIVRTQQLQLQRLYNRRLLPPHRFPNRGQPAVQTSAALPCGLPLLEAQACPPRMRTKRARTLRAGQSQGWPRAAEQK